MADLSTFLKRLDEQVAAARTKVEQKQSELQQAYQSRTERYQTFRRVMEDLRGVAQERLDKLGEHCKFDGHPIEDADGNERQILRANMPFGEVGRGEFGTYYIAYAATPSVTEQMLVNMFIGDPPGNTDRILDFSTAVTGSLFFAPTADFLDDPPDPPGAPEGTTSPSPPEQPSADDGSLGIGSLKRSTK